MLRNLLHDRARRVLHNLPNDRARRVLHNLPQNHMWSRRSGPPQACQNPLFFDRFNLGYQDPARSESLLHRLSVMYFQMWLFNAMPRDLCRKTYGGRLIHMRRANMSATCRLDCARVAKCSTSESPYARIWLSHNKVTQT